MDVLLYLAKSTALLSLFFLVYELFLKKETYFAQNRTFLLLGLFISTALPAVTFQRTIEVVAQKTSSLVAVPVTEGLGVLKPTDVQQVVSVPPSFWESLNYAQILLYMYGAIVLFFLLKFLFKLLYLSRFFRHKLETTTQDGVRYIETDRSENPFSFFNTVIYNPELHPKDELQMILQHERAHAKNWHSVDVIIVNIITYLNWFNPLAWLYRKRVNQNLEFLADRAVTRQMDSPIPYQVSLLRCAVPNYSSLPVNNFHQSFLRTRILMLHKNKSRKSAFLKLGIIVPLLLVFVLGFQVKTVAEVSKAPFVPNKTKQTQVNTSKIQVEIDKNTTQKDLRSLQKWLKEQYNITFKYSQLKFNDKGEVVSLALAVKCPDGYSGKVEQTNSGGHPIKTVYFIRDFDAAAQPFYFGLKQQYKTPKTSVPEEISNYFQTHKFLWVNGKKKKITDLKSVLFKVQSYSLNTNPQELHIQAQRVSSSKNKNAFTLFTNKLVAMKKNPQKKKEVGYIYIEKERVLVGGFGQTYGVGYTIGYATKDKKDTKIARVASVYWKGDPVVLPTDSVSSSKSDYAIYEIGKTITTNRLKEIQASLKVNYGVSFTYRHLKYNTQNALTGGKLSITDKKENTHTFAIEDNSPFKAVYLIWSADFVGFVTPASKTQILALSPTKIKAINVIKDSSFNDANVVSVQVRTGGKPIVFSFDAKSKGKTVSFQQTKKNASTVISYSPVTVKGYKMDVHKASDTMHYTSNRYLADSLTVNRLNYQITKNTSEARLKEIEKIFAARGVTFKVSGLRRNKAGKITNVKVTLDNHEGKKTSVKTNRSSGIAPIHVMLLHGDIYINTQP